MAIPKAAASVPWKRAIAARLDGERNMITLDRISVDPNICLGQPTIRGLRITVSVILKMLAGGKSIDEVMAAYPELEADDVRQAMQYAAWVVSEQVYPLAA
jgi:uncharacterized protein (DUF433 family)